MDLIKMAEGFIGSKLDELKSEEVRKEIVDKWNKDINIPIIGEIPHIIKSVTNVIGFLGETKGGDPIPLRTAEVNRMLGKVDELTMTTDHIAIPFARGENVKVIDGPFNGFNGNIEKVNEEKRKLEVMVKIFGRKTPLELSYMQVEKL